MTAVKDKLVTVEDLGFYHQQFGGSNESGSESSTGVDFYYGSNGIFYKSGNVVTYIFHPANSISLGVATQIDTVPLGYRPILPDNFYVPAAPIMNYDGTVIGLIEYNKSANKLLGAGSASVTSTQHRCSMTWITNE